jgi:polyhydroxyalkanoate synthase
VNGIRYALGHELTKPEPTPKDLVWSQGKIQLWRFRSEQVQYGPPVVLMLGLASKSSLFDLYRGGSMAGYLIEAGFDVYMISWGVAGPAEADNPYEYYTHRYLPRLLRQVVRSSGSEGVTLLGYCMGGNFALVALASQPELPVTNLVTIATPIDWDKMPEHLDPLRRDGFDVADHVDESGCIPPESIVRFNQIRRPTADVVQMANVAERLHDVGYLAVHQAISRWGNDQIPFPRATGQQLVNHWLKENAFMKGTLRANGRPVDLKAITCPVLFVTATRDEIVPAEAARPGIDVVGSTDKQLIELDAGHVGLTFGRSAKTTLHPALAAWLRDHATPSQPEHREQPEQPRRPRRPRKRSTKTATTDAGTRRAKRTPPTVAPSGTAPALTTTTKPRPRTGGKKS